MEISVELAARTGETAAMKITPHGCHSADEAGGGNMVGNNHLQVLVDGEEDRNLHAGRDVLQALTKTMRQRFQAQSQFLNKPPRRGGCLNT